MSAFYQRIKQHTALLIAGAVAAVVVITLLVKQSTPTAESPKSPTLQTAIDPPDKQRARVNASDNYVNSEACKPCHPSVSEEYSHHPMANSVVSIEHSKVIENWSPTSEFTKEDGRTYSATQRDSQYFHVEQLRDASGELIYTQEVALSHVVGSGRRGRTYLINHDGPIYQSSLSWYSNANCWNLSPGYAASSHPRFSRRVSIACLTCHAGRVATKNGYSDQFSHQPFHEEKIGCERCHGPGKQHIEWHSTSNKQGVDPIINPVKLDAPRRDAVCNQCHLQGEKRILRTGQDEGGFIPGMYLSDVWITTLKAESTINGSLVAVNQHEQMTESRCYKMTNGAMGCTACHSPHGMPTPEQKDAFYRNKCLRCHTRTAGDCGLSKEERIAQDQSDSCINCHMSPLSAQSVPHTALTDHRIRKPRHSADVERKPRTTIQAVHPNLYIDDPNGVSQSEINRAHGILLAERATASNHFGSAKQALALLMPLIQSTENDAAAYASAAQASHVLGDSETTRRLLKKVLEFDPYHEFSVELLATMAHESRNPRLAIPYYQKLIEINPWRPEYHGRYSHVLGINGELELGIQESQRALELNPTLIQSHHWLAEAYSRRGNVELSQKHRAILKQFQSIKP